MKVLQWNLLANSLAFSSFDDVEDKHLDWNHRLPVIINKIKTFSPDIFGLEEVDEDKFPDIEKEFPLYSSFFVKKIGINKDGEVIFINKKFTTDRLNIVQLVNTQIFIFTTVWLNDQPENKFIFGVCHLKAKPGFEELRTQQVQIILDAMSNYTIPKIIIGDFNEIPTNPCIQLMQTRFDMYHSKDYTTHKSRQNIVVKRVIDYIFYDKFTLLKSYDAIQPLEGPFPNQEFPSDHIPQVADFQLKE